MNRTGVRMLMNGVALAIVWALMIAMPAATAQSHAATRAGNRQSQLVDIELLEPAYRASIFSTQPQKRIVVRLAVLASRLKAISDQVQVTLHNSAGDQLAQATLAQVGQEAVFDASALPPGQYAVKYRTDAAFTIERSLTITVLPPAPSEVYLDAEGVCMVNGKRFFPLGLFHVGDNLAMINKDNAEAGEPPLTYEEIVRRVATKGFNTIVTVNTQEHVLDAAAEHGLHVIQYADTGDEPLRKWVTGLRHYPALLGWGTGDEPSLEAIVKHSLHKRYAQVRAYDPYHPVLVSNFHAYEHTAGICDVLGPDGYPLSEMSVGDAGRLSALERIDPRPAQAWQAVTRGQSVWRVVQAQGGGGWLTPSGPELRLQAYAAIVSGARGLLFFTYVFGDLTETMQRWRIDRDAPQTWHAFEPLNAELRELMPVLAAPGGEVYLPAQGTPQIRWLKRAHGERLHVIVVNSAKKPQRFELQLPANWKRAKVRWEQRTIELKEGKLKDWIDLFGVRVYEVERS